MSATRQFCTFYLDQLLFGVESQKIQEVIRSLELSSIPLAPAAVGGLVNLRGQIVAALDLRRRLFLEPGTATKQAMGVVVRTSEGAISLLVDEIGDVVEVEEKTFEPLPETVQGEMRKVILGVHKLDKQLMHVLDTERVCDVAEREPNG